MGSSHSWRSFAWVLLAGRLLLMSGPASAGSLGAVIYDNGLAADNAFVFGPDDACECAFFSSSFVNSSSGIQFQMADDFSLSPVGEGMSWAITGAQWSGDIAEGLPDGTFVIEQAWGFEITFNLLFLEDRGPGVFGPTGSPIDPIPGTAIAHRQVTVIGEQLLDWPQALYTAGFEPVLLEGGTNYWFSVVAEGDWDLSGGNIGSSWNWPGREGTGNGRQGGTGFRDFWGANARQQVFTLYGAQVPEPSPAVLLLLACSALALLRARVPLLALATLSLLTPQPGAAAGFDFSLLELEITGQNAFFDDFEDGERDLPPTSSLFTGSTPTTESGGALLFTDTDGSGINADGIPFDTVRLVPDFVAGGGGFEITATLAPVSPTDQHQEFSFDLLPVGALGMEPDPVFGIIWHPEQVGHPSPCGTGLSAYSWDFSVGDGGDFLSCDAIDASQINGSIVFNVIFDEEGDELRFLYSIDGGTTFTETTGFDYPSGPIRGFPPSTTYRLSIRAFGAPEPRTAVLVLIALGGIAMRRLTRR